MFKLFLFFYKKYKRYLNSESGFTLVEIVIAFLIISILTAIIIHSSIMAVNTSKYNKTKTIALSIANEEMEKIRAMDYQNIGITGGAVDGNLQSEVINSDGYTVNYNVSWVNGEDSYKQVEVSVFKEPMKTDIEVLTQIYPTESNSGNGADEHTEPHNLFISSDTGEGINRTIVLNWSTPDTALTISEYKVYRDGSIMESSDDTSYIDNPGGNSSYNYYVTALYEDNTESDPSNEVTAEGIEVHSAPQNLQIVSDTGNNKKRDIVLSWEEPDTSLGISEYKIYRNSSFLENTTALTITDEPGDNNTYTYYVTALYEDGTESESSNEVST